MITKYLVKKTNVATDKNQSFKGMKHITYHGKRGYLFGTFNWVTQAVDNSKILASDIKANGFSSASGARRCYEYMNPDNTEFWKANVEIVRIDISEADSDNLVIYGLENNDW